MRAQRTIVSCLSTGAAVMALAAGSASASAKTKALPTGDGSGGFALTEVGSFNTPIYADNAPGTKSALYVVEQPGLIRVLPGSTPRARPFLDIRALVRCCGEEGLLSMAFHPDYKRNRLLYLYFTNKQGDNELVEFRRKRSNRFVADPGSARRVLYLSHPTNSNHNGGQIQFGPDGFLYIATGDGGWGNDAPNNAQNPESLLGKLLRIDPRPGAGKKAKRKKARKSAKAPYGIPKGNPFAAGPGRDEIYSLGLRNPFRFSFDSGSGAIAIGDVGEGCREEISYRSRANARGVNFGWSAFEGNRLANAGRLAAGMVGPIREYDNSAAGAGCPPLGGFEGVAVINGYVVRDPRLAHQYGRLLYSDVASTDVRSLIPNEAGASDDQSTGVQNPAGSPFSFAEGFRNRVFLISGNGPIYRLDPS